MILATIDTFWIAVIWIALVLYFGLAVVVIIGGAGDIKRLFRTLRQDPSTRQKSESTNHRNDA